MSSLQKHIKTIYISLDCLLDTRLGTLIKLDPDFAYNVSSKPEYYKREEDKFEDEKFGMLSKEVYKEIHDSFKDEIVRLSIKTKLDIFLKELCNTLLLNAINTPFLTGVEIEVNLYPYIFNEDESNNIIRAVSHYLKDEYIVKAVNLSNVDLTCKYVKDNYSALFMYDYGDWLNLYNRELQTKILKEVFLYIPRLNFVRAITTEEQKIFDERNIDSFEFISMLMCEFISIQYLPINLYCADTPLNI